MTHHDDPLHSWFHDEPHMGSESAQERALAITRHMRQRPAWLVAATGGTIADRPTGPSLLRFAVVLGAAVILVALTAGALVLGGILRLPPAPPPFAIESPGVESSAPSPSVAPTAAPPAMPLVFYTQFEEMPPDSRGGCDARHVLDPHFPRCESTRMWVAYADGSGAREVLPQQTEFSRVIALSPDGAHLVFWSWANTGDPGVDRAVAVLADVVGTEPRLANLRILSPPGACVGEDCPTDSGFSFSSDGTELAFVRTGIAGDGQYGDTVIAVMDLASGRVTELSSTAVQYPEGFNGAPEWSPDARQLVFPRGEIGVPSRLLDRTLYVVDADGGNLHQLVPTELFAGGPAWSPDGSRIVFTSAVEWLGCESSTQSCENWNQDSDVYSVRPDGTDLLRLTNDTAAPRVDYGVPVQRGATALISFTLSGGQIVFSRVPLGDASPGTPAVPAELWIMDPDGSNQRRLDAASLAELTAIGCIVCPYPSKPGEIPLHLAYWQPASLPTP